MHGSIMAGAAFIRLTLNDASLNDGLERAKKNVETFSQRAKVAFLNMSVLGDKAFNGFLTMAFPVGTAIREFSRFDDSLRSLQAISGANETAMNGLTKQIRHLGATTAFTASQVADGGVELARMGLSAEELKNAMPAALNLVRATGTETFRLGEIAEFAAASMRIFNLESNQFSDITDVMAYAANRSAMNIADLGEAMKIAGPSANTVGENIRDTAAALMLFANAGIKGSLAGTSLRKIYQSLAAVSGQTEGWTPAELDEGLRGEKQLQEMGIKVVDDNGNLRKSFDIMQDLAAAVKKMKSGEKINFATDVFDLRGSLGALSMLSNPADLKRFREELNNVGSYAEKTAKKIEDGTGGQLRRFKSALEELMLSFGEFMANSLMPFIKGLTNFSLVMSDVVQSFGGVGKFFIQLTGGATAGGLALWALTQALRAAGNGFAPLIAGIKYLDSFASGAKRAAAAAEALSNAQMIADQNKSDIDTAKGAVDQANKRVADIQGELQKQQMIKATSALEVQAAQKSVATQQFSLKMLQQTEAQKLAAVKARIESENDLERLNMTLKKSAVISEAQKVEAQKLAEVKKRCDAEVAIEQQKMAAIQSRYQTVMANNEKARLQYSLQHGSSKGFKDISEVSAAKTELKTQEDILKALDKKHSKVLSNAQKESDKMLENIQKTLATEEKAVADKAKLNLQNIANAEKESKARITAAEKELATRQKILATKTKEAAAASGNVTNTRNTLTNATAAQIEAQKVYGDVVNRETTAEKVLLAAQRKRVNAAKSLIHYVEKSNKLGFRAGNLSLRQAKLVRALTLAQLRAGGASTFMAMRMKLAAGATMALNKALAFLKAHPVMVALGALAIAFKLITSQIQKMKEEFQNALDEAKKLTEEAERATSRNDEKRNTAKDYFERAKQLAEISKTAKLSEKELEEAAFIAKELDPFGSKGWLTLDENTKKLLLAADAAEQFKKGLQNSAVADVENELKALENQLNKLIYKKVDITRTIHLPQGGVFIEKIGEKEVFRDDITDEQLKEVNSIYSKIRDARKRMMKEQVLASKNNYISVSKESKKMIELKKNLSSLEEDLDRKSRSAYENQIHDIKKTRDEHLKLLEQLKTEAKLRNKNADVKMYDEKIASVQARYQKQLDDAKKAEEKRIADSRKSYENFYRDMENKNAFNDKRRQQDEGIESLLNENAFTAALDALNNFMAAEKGIYASLKQEMNKLLVDFSSPTSAGGKAIDASEKAVLDANKSAADAVNSRIVSLQDKIRQVTKQAADFQATDNTRVVGGFSAAVISRALYGSGGSDAKRTADASEKTNRLLTDLKRLASKQSDYEEVYTD